MFRVEQMNLFVVNIDQATNLNNKYRTPRRIQRVLDVFTTYSANQRIFAF